MTDIDLSQLAAWFREHRGQFTDESLVGQARLAGYTDEQIGIAKVGAAPRAGSAQSHPLFWVVLVGYVLLAFVGTLLFSTAFFQSTTDVQGGFFIAVLLGGIIGFVAWRKSRPVLSSALGCGVLAVILIPIIAVVAVAGFCIATGVRQV